MDIKNAERFQRSFYQAKIAPTNLIDRSLINITLIWVSGVIPEYNHLNKPLHSLES